MKIFIYLYLITNIEFTKSAVHRNKFKKLSLHVIFVSFKKPFFAIACLLEPWYIYNKWVCEFAFRKLYR